MSECILMDTVNFKIFDDKGTLITECKHTVRASLLLNKRIFGIDIATFNLDLIKLLGVKDDDKELSDFEKVLNNNKTTIKFSKNNLSDTYKIVADGYLLDVSENKHSHNFNLVIHNAKLSNNYKLDFEMMTPHTPSFVFALDEDEGGNYVDLVLEEV